MRQRDDIDTVLRSTYGFLREHGHVTSKGLAYFRWKRTLGPGPVTTFVAGPDGVVRCDRAWLLAELRLIMLRQGLPLAFVARFDRAV